MSMNPAKTPDEVPPGWDAKMSKAVFDFDSKLREATGALNVDEYLEFGAGHKIHEVITGNSGAFVDAVWLELSGDIYMYKVCVTGKGPKGFGSGDLVLHFTDYTNDRYDLTLTSSTWKQHCTRFNSDKPAIRLISWGDK
jgi:hypothetical protein